MNSKNNLTFALATLGLCFKIQRYKRAMMTVISVFCELYYLNFEMQKRKAKVLVVGKKLGLG